MPFDLLDLLDLLDQVWFVNGRCFPVGLLDFFRPPLTFLWSVQLFYPFSFVHSFVDAASFELFEPLWIVLVVPFERWIDLSCHVGWTVFSRRQVHILSLLIGAIGWWLFLGWWFLDPMTSRNWQLIVFHQCLLGVLLGRLRLPTFFPPQCYFFYWIDRPIRFLRSSSPVLLPPPMQRPCWVRRRRHRNFPTFVERFQN